MVYGEATKNLLKAIDAITNEAMRIAIGVFRTIVIETLHIFTNELPLHYKREELQPRTFFKYKWNFMNPAYNSIVNIYLETFFDTRHTTTLPIILGYQRKARQQTTTNSAGRASPHSKGILTEDSNS